MSLGDCFVNHGNIDCIEIVKLQGTVNHSGILRLPLSSCAPPKLHNVLPAVDVKRCHGTSCGAGHSSYSINWIYRFAYMIYHDISTYVSYIYIFIYLYYLCHSKQHHQTATAGIAVNRVGHSGQAYHFYISLPAGCRSRGRCFWMLGIQPNIMGYNFLKIDNIGLTNGDIMLFWLVLWNMAILFSNSYMGCHPSH